MLPPEIIRKIATFASDSVLRNLRVSSNFESIVKIEFQKRCLLKWGLGTRSKVSFTQEYSAAVLCQMAVRRLSALVIPVDGSLEIVGEDSLSIRQVAPIGNGNRSARSKIPFVFGELRHQATLTEYLSNMIMPSNSLPSSEESCLLPFQSLPFTTPCVSSRPSSMSMSPSSSLSVFPRFIHYFEISIKYTNETHTPTTDECIAIGMSSPLFDISSKLPGWDEFSYGWHSDDSGTFHGSGTKLSIVPAVDDGSGEVVLGCGADSYLKSLFFTRNGNIVSTAFYSVSELISPPSDRCVLYPTIGVDVTPTTIVAVNFGQEKFKFDIESYSRLQMKTTMFYSPRLLPPMRQFSDDDVVDEDDDDDDWSKFC